MRPATPTVVHHAQALSPTIGLTTWETMTTTKITVTARRQRVRSAGFLNTVRMLGRATGPDSLGARRSVRRAFPEHDAAGLADGAQAAAAADLYRPLDARRGL